MPFGIFHSLVDHLPRLTLTAAVDICLVAYLIYQLLLVVRGTRAAHILLGLSLLAALYYISRMAGLTTIHSIMANLIPYSMLAVIVLFQSEIRRTLGRLGRRPFFRSARVGHGQSYDDVLLAVSHLSQSRIGALIVLERDIGLRTFVESGVALDARLSYDLLLTIFYPGCALHDGAVIIQQDKIAAAACFLPVTTNPALASQVGTRHRAAIGVTEESDCVALVVSEETGRISIASAGAIELDISTEVLRRRLISFFGPAASRSGGVRGGVGARTADREAPGADEAVAEGRLAGAEERPRVSDERSPDAGERLGGGAERRRVPEERLGSAEERLRVSEERLPAARETLLEARDAEDALPADLLPSHPGEVERG